MAFGLHFLISGPKATHERTFARPPVWVGRESPSHCILQDSSVSKMHASFDVRDGKICVCDAGSLNGTYVGNEKLPANRWTEIARVGQLADVRISGWTLRVSSNAYDTPVPSVAGSTLAGLLDDLAAASSPGAAPLPFMGTLAVPDLQRNQLGADPRAMAQVGELCRQVDAGLNALFATLVPLLESAPVAVRSSLCDQLAKTFPVLVRDETFFTLFRNHGWMPITQPPSGPLGSAALASLQELARWYLGSDRWLASEAEIVAFKDRLRATLDELLLGYVPLVDGLNRFEREMALRTGAPSVAASAAELARELLDWRRSSESSLLRMRASFADLMVHQVALLNGVMCGVKTLLTELAPAQIEKALQRKRGETFALFRIFRRRDPWPLYKERHSDLSDEENERFKLLFGPEFASEYRQFTQESRVVETEIVTPDGRSPRQAR